MILAWYEKCFAALDPERSRPYPVAASHTGPTPPGKRSMYTEPRTDMASSIAERYREVKERIATAAKRAGRSPTSVLAVAVSKYADLEQVRELVALGHNDFGESRVQQLVQRAAMIDEAMHRRRTLPSVGAGASAPPPPDVRWHMIGHLQRNKVKKLIGVCRLIQSVDSLRLVEEVQAAAFKRDDPVEVLVQVNCAEEKTKFGCAVAAAAHLAEQIDTMVHLRVRGLMTMAPYSENPEAARPHFERLRELFEDIRRRGVGGAGFNILSMGMSHDFEVAIDCGANLVRIGSSIFGDRPPAEEHAEVEEED